MGLAMPAVSALVEIPAVVGAARMLPLRTGQHVDEIGSFLRRAAADGEHVWGEVFKLDNAGIQDALAAVQRRGGFSVLGDAKGSVPGLRSAGGTVGLDVGSYAASPSGEAGASLVQHAKGWATRQELLFSTASPNARGVGQIDATIRLGPDAAEAFRSAVTSGIGGTDDARRSALEVARTRGVVYNDPELGVRHLDDAMRSIIRGADRELRVMPKEFLDPTWAQDLVASKARGVDVRVVTRQIDDRSYQLLREADIPVAPVAMSGPPGTWRFPIADVVTWRRMHFTAVSADGGERVAVGTRYFWEPGKPGERLAREVGVVLGGADGARTEAMLLEQLSARATARDAVSMLPGRR